MPDTTQPIPANAKSWFDRGTFLSVSEHEIFVIDEGSKALPVLVLIHGFPTSSWDFEKIFPYFQTKFRLITLDMLGFGFSGKPDQRSYTIGQQADIFEEVLSKLQVKDVHILAHDYGDTVAQELLSRNLSGSLKQKCTSCCFLNGGLFPETHQALLIQKLLLSRFGKLINKFTGYKQFKSSFCKVFGTATQPSEVELQTFWHLIEYNDGKHVFHNLITYMRDRITHRERWVMALQKSKIPLALINGSVDPVSGSHLVKRYQELNCRLDYLHEMHQIGHYPHCEDAATVAEHTLKFLSLIE